MIYFVYILCSERAGKFYKGHTNDVESWMQRHNLGQEEYTKSGVPWVLIWSTTKPTRTEAYGLEQKLKRLTRKRLVLFMLKHSEGISSTDALLRLKQWSAC